ncbi:MAG: hypothetical protein AAF288_07220 [Planctomycetota bacterium]
MNQPSPDDRVRFRCPRCIGKISSPVATLGLYVSCPHCEARVRVPIPAELKPLGMSRSSIKARQYAQIDKAIRAAQAEGDADKKDVSDQTLEPSGGAVVDFGIDVGPPAQEDDARDAMKPARSISFTGPAPGGVPAVADDDDDDDPEASVSQTEVFLAAIASDLGSDAPPAKRPKGSLRAPIDPMDEALSGSSADRASLDA